MNILILNTDSSSDKKTNGVYTLSIRLIKELNRLNNKVFFLSTKFSGDIFLESIKNDSNLIFLEMTKFVFPKTIKSLPKEKIDIIFSLTVCDTILSTILRDRYFSNARIVFGVYHPLQFFYKKFLFFTYNFEMSNAILKKTPQENIIFMSNLVKEENQKIFKNCFSQSSVIPLPCSVQKEFRWKMKEKIKIVSIGRMVDFKRYPFAIMNALVKLKREGVFYEYHIYGDGPLSEEMKEYAMSSGAFEFTFFHGHLKYENIESVLSTAYLFAGHGTSIVEASGHGVLSLCMPAYMKDDDEMYGPFYKLPWGEVGDYSNFITKYSLLDELRRCFHISYEDYARESFLCYEHAKNFSQEKIVKNYLSVFNYASKNQELTFSARQYQLFRYIGSFLSKIKLGVDK